MAQQIHQEGIDWESLGFSSADQFDLAQALARDCSGFNGLESLSTKTPRVFGGAQALMAAGSEFIDLPKSMLGSLGAGPGGPLGRSILSAPSRSHAAPVARFEAPQPKDAPKNVQARDDDGMWDMDGYESAHAPKSASVPKRRPQLEEGEGEDSLNAIITKLENNGFGDPATAELVRLNRLKASKSGRKP